ncbi:MAG: LemA family protein [Candidatus Binataceae bacterium]|nr:LemA family protein [Candidatus Binataceae bacterium]
MIAVLIVLGLIALYAMFGYNSLVRMRNEVENAWRQIDVQLKRRHDLIPNLVEAVKGYMQFERDTLTQVVEARGRAIAAPDQASRLAAENQITGGLGRLLAVMENYPQLKADQNVMQLQEQLTTTENQLSFARQAYNDAVLALNTRIETFPTNVIANNFGFKAAEYFKVAPEEQAVPKVDLSLGGAPHA